MAMRSLASIAIFLLTFNTHVAIASSVPANVEITGDHYINARSLQQETGRFSIKNNSDTVLTNINVITDAKTLTINNPCQAGLLPNQSCTVTYTFHAGQDVSEKHNDVSSKLENLQISYQQAKETYQTSFFVVTNHIDSLRLLSLPMSRSSYHNIASSQTNDIRYDNNTHTIYLATARGLSISDDGGSNWQTLTPFNSSLNSKNDITEIGKFAPKFTYVDEDKLYVVLSDFFHIQENLMMSKDHGATWTNLKKFNGFFELAAQDNDIYIARYGLDISHDGGKTWQTKFAGQRILSVALDGKSVYIGTDDGIQVSQDKGETFNPILSSSKFCGNNSNHCSVNKLKLIGNDIYALVSNIYPSATRLIKGNAQGFKSILLLDVDDYCDYAVQGQNIVASCYGSLIQISKDAGQSWSVFHKISMHSNFAAGNQIILFPADNKIQSMILSGDGLPVITDLGETWRKLSVGKFPEYEMRRVVANKAGVLMISTLRFERGLNDKTSTIGISKDDGTTWQPIFADQATETDQNNNIFTANDKFYYYNNYLNYIADLYHSDESGENWSHIETQSIIDNIEVGPDGVWYTVTRHLGGSPKYDTVNIEISTDQGQSWHVFGPVIDSLLINTFKVIPGSQATLLSIGSYELNTSNTDLYIQTKEQDADWKKVSFPNTNFAGLASEDKSIYLLSSPVCLNCGQSAYLYASHDLGVTWAKQEIPMPPILNSSPCLLSVKAGKIYLALPGRDGVSYHKLVVSNDDGKTWVDLGSLVAPLQTSSGVQFINNMTFTNKEIFIATEIGLYSIGNVDSSENNNLKVK